jgi:hypothetical protein
MLSRDSKTYLNLCRGFLQKSPDNAAAILAHGIKHNYPELINEAVPHLSRLPLITMLEKIPPLGLFPWVNSIEIITDTAF